MKPHAGAARLHPRWWDHQRHLLSKLRDAISRLLDDRVKPCPGQLVLDLGCGDRPYEPLFRSRGCQYLACDLGGEVDVLLEPGRPIAIPDASADGIGSFQVLEHVWELDWYLGECHRLLKPRGWLLLSTHGNWLYHPHPGDYRRWTRDGLVRELHERGFAIEAVEAVVGPLAWTTQFRLLGYRHALLRLPVVGRLILLPLTCLMNLRMVLEDLMTPTPIREANACVYVVLCRKPAPTPNPRLCVS